MRKWIAALPWDELLVCAALTTVVLVLLVGCAGLTMQGTTQEVGSENLRSLVEMPNYESIVSELSGAGMSGDQIAVVLAAASTLPPLNILIYQISGDADTQGQWEADLRAWLARTLNAQEDATSEEEVPQ